MASSFALVYSEVGRGQEALQLTEQVLEAYKSTLGAEHPDTLRSMHSLALRYSEAGRIQESLQLTEQVLEARKRTLGAEHPDTLASIDTLSYLSRNLQGAHKITYSVIVFFFSFFFLFFSLRP